MSVGVVLIVLICVACLWYFFRNVDEEEEGSEDTADQAQRKKQPGTSVTKVVQMEETDYESSMYPFGNPKGSAFRPESRPNDEYYVYPA